MANKTMDSAREFETQAKELLERVKRMQNDLGAALQSVKRAESELIDKEKRAEKERMEKERAERLREVLTSEGDLAFHVGDDRAEEQPAPAESKSEVNEKPKPEPVKEQKAYRQRRRKAYRQRRRNLQWRIGSLKKSPRQRRNPHRQISLYSSSARPMSAGNLSAERTAGSRSHALTGRSGPQTARSAQTDLSSAPYREVTSLSRRPAPWNPLRLP